MDEILRDYSRSIDNGQGGLLLAIIGGRLSEGINFSDKLGRGVVVVGLPFPNAHSADWKAKREYVEKVTYDRIIASQDTKTIPISAMDSTARTQAQAAGRDFYENACMRAVNQSIGRAIRHQNDYACIILLDKRYEDDRIKRKLPGWIQKGLVQERAGKGFAEVMSSLSSFFRSKGRQKQLPRCERYV